MGFLYRIKEWLENRGVSRVMLKNLIYFFLPIVAMVLSAGALHLAWRIGIILTVAVLKQIIWDVIIHKQNFDYIDILHTAAGVAVGIIFTYGS